LTTRCYNVAILYFDGDRMDGSGRYSGAVAQVPRLCGNLRRDWNRSWAFAVSDHILADPATKTQRSTVPTSATASLALRPRLGRRIRPWLTCFASLAWRTQECNPCSDRTRLAACPEGVDCSNPRHPEAGAPGREHRSSRSRTYVRRSPRDRERLGFSRSQWDSIRRHRVSASESANHLPARVRGLVVSCSASICGVCNAGWIGIHGSLPCTPSSVRRWRCDAAAPLCWHSQCLGHRHVPRICQEA